MSPSVLVLGVLHDQHARTPGYTYWHLRKLLDASDADLICIAVRPDRRAR